MSFETLLDKYNSRVATIYNQTVTQITTNGDLQVTPYRTSVINSSQPYIFIKPNTTTASAGVPKGRFGYAFTSNESRIKNDTRDFPLVSSIRDFRRVREFSKSQMGTRFIAQQTALQLFNAYPKTRLWNPVSVFASSAGSLTVGTTLVGRFINLQSVLGGARAVVGLFSGAKNVGTSSAITRDIAAGGTQPSELFQSRANVDTQPNPLERGFFGLDGYFTKATSNKKLINQFLSSLNPLSKKTPKSNIRDILNNKSISENAPVTRDNPYDINYGFLERTGREGRIAAPVPQGSEAKDKYDIITFTFGNVGTYAEENKIIPFRAFISEMKENVKTEFNEQRYIGRTERFVTYAGAKRSVTLQFNVVALSQDEILHTWTRINYLTGLAFPKNVSASGFMVPPLFRFTVGTIYQNQPCYIETLDYEFIGENTTFDIDYEASQMIKVNMSLQLIEKASRYSNSKFYAIMEDILSNASGPAQPAQIGAATSAGGT